MPPECEDSDQTQTPEHTPAYHNSFGPNTHKLQHLVRFSLKAIENYTAQVNTLSTELADLPAPQAAQVKKSVEEVAKQAKDFTGGVLAIREMMPVLFVAVVEAYLKDVLIFAAGIDTTLMKRTGQTVTYQDALNAKSLEELILDFRTEWARSFVDNGGPTTWTKRLEKMGASHYRPETVSQIETLWGARHLIVHSAGIANADFVRRHPELKAQVGKRMVVTEQLRQWSAAMYDFVEITDQYFVQRCKKSQKLLRSQPVT